MYEFFIDFLFNLINNSGWRHVSPVTRCWPGQGAAGEDISIVIAGLVSCPSDIHYFIMMNNPSEHQLCDDTLESLGNFNLSVLPRKEENSLLLGDEPRDQCIGQPCELCSGAPII